MFANFSPSLIRSFPFILKRYLMNSAHFMNKNKYLGREANMLNKLMSSSKKKRKYFIYETPTPSAGSLNLGNEFRSSKENSRRVAVLNKLFIKNISDILVSGSFSDTVLDKGLEITRVAITPNFNQVNVFWTTNNEKNLDALEAILPDIGFNLRHELSQLQVMGRMPRIVFVKDKHHTDALKVDAVLRNADYGEDYEPCNTGSDFYLSQGPQVNISDKEEKSIRTDEESSTEEEQMSVELLPVMRQDTLNLDHNRILNKIMKSMKKSRALHRFEPNLAIDGEGINPSNCNGLVVDNMTKQERKEALSKFILERRLLKERRYRDKYNAHLNGPIYEINYMEEDNELEDLSTEDFIDDDDFESKKDKI